MGAIARAWVSLVALAALTGCAPLAVKPTAEPVIVVVYDGGMAPEETRSSGVRLAVWEDGSVLVAMDPMHPSREMRVGRVPAARVTEVLGALERAGFFSRPPTFLVAPDAESVSLRTRFSGTVRVDQADWYHQSWLAWWPDVMAALEPLRPAETRPVSEVAEGKGGVEFRGYVLAAWYRTPWIR